MSMVFSQSWADAFKLALGASDAYRAAAARWEGALVLRLQDEAVPRSVFLDLHHGECRDARPADSTDVEEARFVLSATIENWKNLLSGSVAPLAAVMSGKLKLEKGSTFELLPHVKAAEELLAAALDVPTEFPGDDTESADPAAPSEQDASSAGVVPVAPPAVNGAPEPAAEGERTFRMTRSGGLDFDSPVLRLWSKAKRDGIWNPEDIDFTRDREDWLTLTDDERDLLLRLAALFGAGEESVVVDLLPLMQVIASEGRLDEEIYLTSFLWEEAKHVESFRRFFDQVAQDSSDLSRYHTPSYKKIFYEELPAAMNRLGRDACPIAQAEASTTYNLIVEGVLAETGYYVYGRILKERDILPGMQFVISKLAMDESRHLAYGVYLLSRLVAEHGDEVWQAIEARMNALIEPATQLVEEAFRAYDPENVPFSLGLDVFMDYALSQFEKRLKRVELARRQELSQIVGQSRLVEEARLSVAGTATPSH